MLQTQLVEEIRTHFYVQKLLSGNCANYEIMWKNTAEPDRPQMIVWHRHFACWITKDTDTLSDYVT